MAFFKIVADACGAEIAHVELRLSDTSSLIRTLVAVALRVRPHLMWIARPKRLSPPRTITNRLSLSHGGDAPAACIKPELFSTGHHRSKRIIYGQSWETLFAGPVSPRSRQAGLGEEFCKRGVLLRQNRINP